MHINNNYVLPQVHVNSMFPQWQKHPKVRSYARSFPNVLLWVQTCLLTMLSENNWSRRRILWKKRWIRYMAIFEYKTCLFCISIVYTYSFCLLWYPQPIVATERCTLYIYTAILPRYSVPRLKDQADDALEAFRATTVDMATLIQIDRLFRHHLHHLKPFPIQFHHELGSSLHHTLSIWICYFFQTPPKASPGERCSHDPGSGPRSGHRASEGRRSWVMIWIEPWVVRSQKP